VTLSVRACVVNGRQARYRQDGAGEHLLYLHGIGGDFLWLPFHRALAQEFTVTLPVHPGFGESQDDESAAGMEDLVFHYVDLIDALGLGRVHLIGASFGGWIAAELAVRYPDRIRTLALIDAVGLDVPGAPVAELFLSDPKSLATLLFHDPAHPFARLLAEADPADPSQVSETLRHFKVLSTLARVGWNPYLHNPKLSRLLSRITAPTLILWGEEDRLVPLPHAEAYRKAISGARIERIPACGHLPPVERPLETVSRLLAFYSVEKSSRAF